MFITVAFMSSSSTLSGMTNICHVVLSYILSPRRSDFVILFFCMFVLFFNTHTMYFH